MSSNRQTSLQQRLFQAACLLCAIPVLVATYPPMVDVPQHAAQIESVRGFLDGSWKYADLFSLKLFTPYWLGYGLVYLLSGLTGIVWATKLVVAATACALPWTIARFCNRAGTDPRWNWLFLLLPFGYAYDWGFLNFYVALPFGFLFLEAALRLRDSGSARTILGIVLWLHFMFFAHMLVTAFCCAIAVLMLASPWQGVKRWIGRSLPVFSVLPITVAWTVITIGNVGSGLSFTFWDYGLHRITDLPATLVAAPASLPGYLVAAFALAMPWLTGARPVASLWRWAPFLFYLAWMLLFAHHIFGTSHTYQRFGNLGLPLYLLGFQPALRAAGERHARLAAVGVIAVALSMLGWNAVRAMVFNAETASYRDVIAQAQPGGRMLMLIMDRDSRASAAPVFLHFPAWYQAQRGGLVEFNFSRFDVTPLSWRDPDESGIQLHFEWTPHTLDWTRHKGALYDYVIVRSPRDESPALYRISGCAIILVANEGPWWLYARSNGAPHPDPACAR